MAILAPLLLCLLAKQSADLKPLSYRLDPVYPAGFVETVMGVKPRPLDTLDVCYLKTYDAALGGTGVIPGGGALTAVTGFSRWSVENTTLDDQDCYLFKSEAFSTSTVGKEHASGSSRIDWYWVTADGTILRQFRKDTDVNGVDEADATYVDDHIDVTIRLGSQKSETTVYPKDMQRVQNRFRTMVAGEKVTVASKEFEEFDPIRLAFKKWTVKSTSQFREGKAPVGFVFTFTSDKERYEACIAYTGRLAQVDVGRNRRLLPHVGAALHKDSPTPKRGDGNRP